MTTDRYTSSGKQVLLDGLHYGDMVNESAARLTAHRLNTGDPLPTPEPTVALCQITKQQDEWFCATHGTRWDDLDQTPKTCNGL